MHVLFRVIKKRNDTDGMELDETRVRVPSIYWIPILICGVMLFFADVFQIQYFTVQLSKPRNDSLLEDRSLIGFTINTPGCKIPYMDPLDEHIRKYIETPSTPTCNKGLPSLFVSNLTSIYLQHSSLPLYNITETNVLKCCFTPFWRIDPKKDEVDDKIKFSSNCYAFNESTKITDEFIRVTCKYDNTTIYKDTFSFVPLKTKDITNDSKKLNVLVIGLDAVSRLNLHRQMLKTVKYLKEIEAVELLGYNKVGDNTFPNLMPVLTGFSETELRNNCWPSLKSYFDNCPFVWKLYKNKTYITAYGEDSSWMGLFNYQRRGFKKQTTDYAYNYFNRITEHLIGNSHSLNVDQCEGGRLVYKDLLEYVKKFVTTMENNRLPYFGFFWGASLSHDDLNKPKLGDQDYYLFFKYLYENKYIDNTIVIFMSDHGIRWGEIRQTFQGRMEERLPFVFLMLPKFFKNKYRAAYQNLIVNTRRLTTPFDLHETLLDLANTSNLLLEKKLKNTSKVSRGLSFFRYISKERTCEDADIASHWCTCQQSIEVNKNESNVKKAAYSAIQNINNQLSGYAQCAELILDKIINARLSSHSSQISGSNEVTDYMLTLQTLPNKAVFEVTLRKQKNDTFEVIGSISRLNLYGEQSSCITDYHLKLYCYCKNLLL